LQLHVEGKPLPIRPRGLAEEVWRRCRDNPVLAGMASVLIVGFVVSYGLLTIAWRDAEKNAREAEFQAGIAWQQYGRSEEARERFELNLLQARQALDAVAYLSANESLRAPALQPLRRQIFEVLLTYFRQFLSEYGHSLEFEGEAARIRYRVAMILDEIGDRDQAITAYEEALAAHRGVNQAAENPYLDAVLGRLAGGPPGEFRHNLASIYNGLGNLWYDKGEYERALGYYDQAVEGYEQLARDYKDYPLYRSQLARVIQNRGGALEQLKRYDEAAADYQSAVDHQKAVLDKDGGPAEYRRWLAGHYEALAGAQRGAGRVSAAAAAAWQLQGLWPEDPEEQYRAARELALCAAAVGAGKPQLTAGEEAERRQYAEEAMKVLRQAVRHGFKDVKRLSEDAALAALRERDDFRALLDEVRRPAGKP
jgi:tetratricopeptide (TPR) repeat protein